MATLILTTIGQAFGGPLGGAVGALLGQVVDSRLLAPKLREGPRLSDLRVQLSSYGTPIPRVLGRMRMAGTVIWATQLVEHRRVSGGKGRGRTAQYGYSLSLAVALSSRPVSAVGRIWAEGNLLRGSDGAFTSQVQMRLHHGSENQMPDPLIVAAEGVGHCPAYRGLAYVVLEDMDLVPFGNRIPSLTFEVMADDRLISLVDIAADALGTSVGAERDVPGPRYIGWAHGAATRGAALRDLGRLETRLHHHVTAGWQMQLAGPPLTLKRNPADNAEGGRDPALCRCSGDTTGDIGHRL